MVNETKIVLDADAKEYALKAISEVYSGFSFLYNQLKEDQAERSLVDSVLGLSEYYIAKIGDRLGYNGTLKKELEERHIDNKLTLSQLADKGRSRLPKGIKAREWVRLALEGDIGPEDIIVDKWVLPAGAFTGAGGGPG